MNDIPTFYETGYDAVGDLYDLEYPDCTGPELDFWISECRRFGARILELGVGTGRIAGQLASHGFEVTGVDSSEGMLDRAAAKQSAMSLNTRRNLTLVHGNMQNYCLKERFDLVFVGFNSYLLLPDVEARVQTLSNAVQHLRPGGGVAVDIFSATPLDSTPDHEYVEFLEAEPTTGKRITRERFYSYDASTHRGQSTLIYRFHDGGKIVNERQLGYSLALLSRDDLVLEFLKASLETETVHGTYTRDPWRADSPNLIVVGRRRVVDRPPIRSRKSHIGLNSVPVENSEIA